LKGIKGREFGKEGLAPLLDTLDTGLEIAKRGRNLVKGSFSPSKLPVWHSGVRRVKERRSLSHMTILARGGEWGYQMKLKGKFEGASPLHRPPSPSP